jgi:hypothetical protein
MHKGPAVRFNLQCVSVKHIPADVESFAYGESFIEGIEDLIDTINLQVSSVPVIENSGEWFQTYYYTNEDEGYYFYTEEDMAYKGDENEL